MRPGRRTIVYRGVPRYPSTINGEWVERLARYAMTKHGLAGALRAGTSSDATLFDETYDAIVGALAKRGARETHVRELRIIRAKEGRQMADERGSRSSSTSSTGA